MSGITQEEVFRKARLFWKYSGDPFNGHRSRGNSEAGIPAELTWFDPVSEPGAFRDAVALGKSVSFSPSPHLMVAHERNGNLVVIQADQNAQALVTGAAQALVITEFSKNGGIERHSVIGKGGVYRFAREHLQWGHQQEALLALGVGSGLTPGIAPIALHLAKQFQSSFPNGLPESLCMSPESRDGETELIPGVTLTVRGWKGAPPVSLYVDCDKLSGKETGLRMRLESCGGHAPIKQVLKKTETDAKTITTFTYPLQVEWMNQFA